MNSPLLLQGKGDVWTKLRAISKEWGIEEDPVTDASNTPNRVWSRRFTQEAMQRGHDGVVLPSVSGQTEYVAFASNQIKSAIGNSGKFDPNSASLTDPLDAAPPPRAEAESQTPRDDAPQEATAAAPPNAIPRDIKAESIALRKAENLLSKLLECVT